MLFSLLLKKVSFSLLILSLFSNSQKYNSAFKTYYDDLLGDVTQIEEKKEKAKKEKREKKDPDAEEEK